jgi:hypothetical protein
LIKDSYNSNLEKANAEFQPSIKEETFEEALKSYNHLKGKIEALNKVFTDYL